MTLALALMLMLATPEKPLIVVVTTQGCAPCKVLVNRLSAMRQRGEIDVSLLVVNAATLSEADRRLLGGIDSAPVLLVFRRVGRHNGLLSERSILEAVGQRPLPAPPPIREGNSN